MKHADERRQAILEARRDFFDRSDARSREIREAVADESNRSRPVEVTYVEAPDAASDLYRSSVTANYR